ncbi:MAG: hypothetical protein ACE5I5_16800 [Candidatus Heimdallarchaeota archaeon]
MTTVSLILSTEEITRLQGRIQKLGLRELSLKSPHELLRIKHGDVQLVVYKTGSVVHNGSQASRELVHSILIVDKMYDFVVGSDEAGKGEWQGPLVVEAVALSPTEINALRELGVKDSKIIKKKRLLELAEKLLKLKFKRKLLLLRPKTYNEQYSEFKKEGKSMNDLLAWAHTRVIKNVLKDLTFERIKIVIDKFDVQKTDLRLKTIASPNIEILQKTGGESEIPVAAASILAKYVYEIEVNNLEKKYQLDLRNSSPTDILPSILPHVAKIHFKNVKTALKQ